MNVHVCVARPVMVSYTHIALCGVLLVGIHHNLTDDIGVSPSL